MLGSHEGGCIIPNVYAKLYCYVNITPYSEVSLYKVCNNIIVVFIYYQQSLTPTYYIATKLYYITTILVSHIVILDY